METIQPLIYFESLVLCLILLLVLFIANIRFWRPVIFNRLSLIYIFVAVTILCYIGWSFVDGKKDLAWLNMLFTIGSSFFMTMSCMFYYYYVLKNVGITYENGKFWYISSFFAIGGALTLYVISIWTGTAFYIDNEGHYQRGVLFFGDLIASYAYVACGVVFALVKSIKSELLSDKHKFLTIALCILPCVALGIVNNILPYPYGLPTVFYGILVSLLIVFAASSAGRITRDPLTKLLNRFSFDSLLAQAIKKKGQDLYLLMIDINGFKGINDTFGHTVGDEVLMRISTTLANVCDDYKATVARWGGDEFTVFIETGDELVAQKLLVDLKTRVLTECNQDERFTVSISVGMSKLREYETMKHFLEEADHKLYEDKKKFHRLNQ